MLKLFKVAFALGIAVIGSAGFYAWITKAPPTADPLPTGKFITPIGSQQEVGSYPANLALSPNGRYLAVSNIGFRQFLTLLRTTDGSIASQLDFNGDSKVRRGKSALYYGLTWAGDDRLFVSRGVEDAIGVYEVTSDGKLTEKEPIRLVPSEGSAYPLHIAGLASDAKGRSIYAVNNQTHVGTDFRGSLSVVDAANGRERHRVAVGGYPYAVAAMTQGANADQKVYVACEQERGVWVVDPVAGRVLKTIQTGLAPVALALDGEQKRLFVANSGSDTVSVVDTATDRVVKTLLLRAQDVRQLPGATPIGFALSPSEDRLYVALADMNAIAVVRLPEYRLEGYLPAGWYPTSLAVSQDGRRLFVANAKGVRVRNPNGKPVGNLGQYIQNIIEGTVGMIDLDRLPPIGGCTELVMENNRIRPGLNSRTDPSFKNPGIEHVIYIVKENRTYDQVLGDLPRGNGDPSLCLFPREVTPNQHALSERFVLMDNFYVCAEVSADGWNWSTSGMANPYTSRNTVTNYSGRGRDYDFEGANSGAPVDLMGKNDVARSPGGYIWDLALRHKVSVRNFGMFTVFADPSDKRYTSIKGFKENLPNKKALVGITDPNFRRYDMAYADSDAWVKHGVSAPQQLKSSGDKNDPSRFTAWKRSFDAMIAKGSVPKLMLVRFGNDHTWGTAEGRFSPRACVADNDYAVGLLVEAVSRSPIWKKTAIFILEDDAQAGHDHVDAHRSTAYVISPFVKRGLLYSEFGNTVSLLRTMELLLGLPPMNQYDAAAPPLQVFGDGPENIEPYTAVLPAKEIVCEINKRGAYRAADSARLLHRFHEESMSDLELNDILWTSIKGNIRPRTAAPRFRDEDDLIR